VPIGPTLEHVVADQSTGEAGTRRHGIPGSTTEPGATLFLAEWKYGLRRLSEYLERDSGQAVVSDRSQEWPRLFGRPRAEHRREFSISEEWQNTLLGDLSSDQAPENIRRWRLQRSR